MTRIRPGASPCRGTTGEAPRHVCSREHAAVVEGYRAWRAAWDAEHESVSLGWPTEAADHRAASPPPTFRRYLTRP